MTSLHLLTIPLLGASMLAAAVSAAERSPLFKNGEDTASFRLSEVGLPDRPSPEKELLDADENKQAIAQLLKDERNKSIKPGQIPPADKDAAGIKIRFDGIRLIRDPEDPTKVRIRLVGPINEIEYRTPLLITDLLESKKSIPVQFKSVTKKTGVTVTILTDLRLKWQNGDLVVSDTKGTIDFEVGLLSPARLFYSSDSDSVSLPNLEGKRVTEAELPFRSLLEPEKL